MKTVNECEIELFELQHPAITNIFHHYAVQHFSQRVKEFTAAFRDAGLTVTHVVYSPWKKGETRSVLHWDYKDGFYPKRSAKEEEFDSYTVFTLESHPKFPVGWVKVSTKAYRLYPESNFIKRLDISFENLDFRYELKNAAILLDEQIRNQHPSLLPALIITDKYIEGSAASVGGTMLLFELAQMAYKDGMEYAEKTVKDYQSLCKAFAKVIDVVEEDKHGDSPDR